MYVMFYVLKRVFGTFWRIAGCSGQKPALRASGLYQAVKGNVTESARARSYYSSKEVR